MGRKFLKIPIFDRLDGQFAGFGLTVVLIAFAGAAEAQEEAIKVGLALVEQTTPLRDCLKNEMAAAQSNETALAIAENACADVSAAL